MQGRVILDKNHADISNINECYQTLLTSPPLLFAEIARKLLPTGVIEQWRASTNSSARVLAYACDVVQGQQASFDKFIKEWRLADKSSFENFDRMAYLVDALMLARQNSNVIYYDMAPMGVPMDDIYKEVSQTLGDYAEHFWRDMPDHFFLHVMSHLTEPYRIQRLSRWANQNWPVLTEEERQDYSVIRQSNFSSYCHNLILKILLSRNLQWFDKEGLKIILQSAGENDPLLMKLSLEHRLQVLLSLSWTARMASKEDDLPFPEASPQPLYKNFSHMHLGQKKFDDTDLRGANFYGADLNCTSFVRCQLMGANFTNSNYMYSGAVFDQSPPSGADFAGADLTGAIFQGARVEALNIEHAVLRDVDFRHAIVCEDSELYTMRLSEAADTTGISFAHAVFMMTNIFKDFDIGHIDITGFKLGLSYYDQEMYALDELLNSGEIEAKLMEVFEYRPDSFYLLVTLYLATKQFHESAHDIMARVLMANESEQGQRLLVALEAMRNAEVIRLVNLQASMNISMKSNQFDFPALLNLRLVNKAMSAKVALHFSQHPLDLLDYCLQFVSTSKLNEVAEFCQTLNILDGWMESNNGYTRLFALLMKSRLGQPVDFNGILPQEVAALISHDDFSFTDFHRLAYLSETICSDHGKMQIPVELGMRLGGFDSATLMDEIVSNLATPVKLFRLGECLSDEMMNPMRELAMKAVTPKDVVLQPDAARLFYEPVILSVLFSDVYWEGHVALERYLESIKGEMLLRYGKERRDILYHSIWITRGYPRGSSTTYRDDCYKNLIGFATDSGYIFHAHNVGANLKGATLVGGLTFRGVNDNFSNAWLKSAKLIIGHDKRRNFIKCNFKEANLCGAEISDAVLDYADFTSADLRRTEWANVSAKAVNLAKANCTDILFYAVRTSDFTLATSSNAQVPAAQKHKIDMARTSAIATANQVILATATTEELHQLLEPLLTPFQRDESVNPQQEIQYPSPCHTNGEGFPTNAIDFTLAKTFIEHYLLLNVHHPDLQENLLKLLTSYLETEEIIHLRERVQSLKPVIKTVVPPAAPEKVTPSRSSHAETFQAYVATAEQVAGTAATVVSDFIGSMFAKIENTAGTTTAQSKAPKP